MTEKEKYALSIYKITEDGKVFSNLNNRFHGQWVELKTRLDKDGYKEVSLIYDESGNRQPFKIHRLVACKYVPNPNNYPVINHKDLNKLNNNVENLEWCTISYNTQHGFDHCAYNSIKKVKVTLIDGKVYIFPNCSFASRYFGYKNPSSINTFAIQCKIPVRGKLCGAKIEFIDKGVTTIEKNVITANNV